MPWGREFEQASWKTLRSWNENGWTSGQSLFLLHVQWFSLSMLQVQIHLIPNAISIKTFNYSQYIWRTYWVDVSDVLGLDYQDSINNPCYSLWKRASQKLILTIEKQESSLNCIKVAKWWKPMTKSTTNTSHLKFSMQHILHRTPSNFNKEQNTRKPFHHVIMTWPVSSN